MPFWHAPANLGTEPRNPGTPEPTTVYTYSVLRLATGSTFAARNDGTNADRQPTIASPAATVANVAGSLGAVAKRKL